MKGYDLLLKGGHVIDPANNINRKMDVAVIDGKIARVAEEIPESEVKKVLSSYFFGIALHILVESMISSVEE